MQWIIRHLYIYDSDRKAICFICLKPTPILWFSREIYRQNIVYLIKSDTETKYCSYADGIDLSSSINHGFSKQYESYLKLINTNNLCLNTLALFSIEKGGIDIAADVSMCTFETKYRNPATTYTPKGPIICKAYQCHNTMLLASGCREEAHK